MTSRADPGVLSTAARVSEAADAIRQRGAPQPRVAVILGSGLGDLAVEVSDAVTVRYRDIPHFPVSTVHGHAGELVCGMLQGTPVAAIVRTGPEEIAFTRIP